MEDIFPMLTNDRKLNGENYLRWKRMVEISLRGTAMARHLTQGPPSPMTKQWQRQDAHIFHQMMNSMKNNAMDHILHLNTVKQAWDRLAAVYCSPSRKYEICRKYFRVKQGNRSVDEYADEFNRLYAEFSLLFPETDDFEERKLQRDEWLVFRFINGLLPEYERTCCRILEGRETVPSKDEMHRLLLLMHPEEEEERLEGSGSGSGSVSSCGGYRGGRRECNYCGRKGHIRDTCWDLHGKPSPFY